MKVPWSKASKLNSMLNVRSPVADEAGWTVPAGDPETPAEIYAQQLVDERYAVGVSDGIAISWSALFRLLKDEQHAGSIGLLALPPAASIVPRLACSGTPSDSTFSVRIDGWATASGAPVLETVARNGAVVTHGGRDELLSESAFQLICAIHTLRHDGPRLSSEARMLAIGKIQSLAKASGAIIDNYLSKTRIEIPERLDLAMRVSEAAGASVVEITPIPENTTPEWLVQFDRHNAVRARYDVVRPDGEMSHVMMSEPMREALAPIKRMPGRRAASRQADAFLHNPHPFLGENAEAILPEGKLEQMRRDAGYVEREMDARPDGQGWDILLSDSTGLADALSEHVSEQGEAIKLVALGKEARQRGLTIFRWKGHRVSLAGSTVDSLQRLQAWTTQKAVREIALRLGDVFNLEAYSDRVVGFDGRPIHVPFIGPADAAKGWFPENIEMSVATVDPTTGQASSVRLDPNDLATFRQATQAAQERGDSSVALPGSAVEVPVDEARAWIDGIKDVLRKKAAAPSAPKDPAPRSTPSLRILHNIEQLDYGSESQLDAPPPVEPELPNALRTGITLMPHQRLGLAWLQCRYKQRELGVRGVLLADDMGLGKTLQCLSLMAWYRQTAPSPKPCLIVAPVSLLENWKAEIEKWLDGSQGRTLALYGSELASHRLHGAELDPQLREIGMRKLLRPGFARGAAFVLTTYETLRDYDFSLGREAWGVLVCDEAQKIKTPGALVTRSSKAMQADFKIACTGTPVENTLADLWCLFDFFQPALLGSLRDFTQIFRKAIERREEGFQALVERLRVAVDPWILRRMKTDVAQLPPKIDEMHARFDSSSMELPMSALQRQIYVRTVSEFKDALELSEKTGGAQALIVLHKLRMVCANPVALGDDKGELMPVSEHLQHNPKLRWLLEHLEIIRTAGEKAIVFTEFRDIQRLLKRAIAGRFGIPVSIVNGSTTVEAASDDSRQRVIDRFQDSPGFGVIVLSTTAVGFGVNIQAANHVVHYTRPWNPAKEDQATDRAYRIGQTKPVWVHCPTVTGDGFESFEQRLALRLASKRALSRDMLAPQQALGLEDFKGLEEA